jgi:GDPmannose 4,6-dehydratase
MWRMLQLEKSEDFVIATGETFTLEDFVAYTFEALELNWRDHVKQDKSLFRPTDVMESFADASYAKEKLDWVASIKGQALVNAMLNLTTNSA